MAPDRAEDLDQLVVRMQSDGSVVRVGDVASTVVGLRKANRYVINDGEPSIAMLFAREAGSNVLGVTEAVIAEAERLDTEVMATRGLRISVVSDQRAYIRGALELVQNNLLVGGVLAVGVQAVSAQRGGFGNRRHRHPGVRGGHGAGHDPARPQPQRGLAGRNGVCGGHGGRQRGSWCSKTSTPGATGRRISRWRPTRPPGRSGVLPLVASTATTAAVFIPIIAWQDEVASRPRRGWPHSMGLSFVVSSKLSRPWSAAARLLGSRTRIAQWHRVRSAGVRDALMARIRSVVVSRREEPGGGGPPNRRHR